MDTKHTPTPWIPWRAEARKGRLVIVDADGYPVLGAVKPPEGAPGGWSENAIDAAVRAALALAKEGN